jgi:hypothetical protein
MLSDKIRTYLRNEKTAILPEHQEPIRKALLAVGCAEDKNSSFVEFITQYSDEHYGKQGLMFDLGADLLDLPSSVANSHWSEGGVPRCFLPLVNHETEAYLFYNTSDDSVVLVEDGSLPRLLAGDHDGFWPSFNDFLEDHFELSGAKEPGDGR